MEMDVRYSMYGDSEWSVCDELEADDVRVNAEENHSPQFYDVPPGETKNNLICDVTSSVESMKLGAADHKAFPIVSKERKSLSPEPKQSLSFGCKVYIAVLSFVVLIEFGVLSFIVVREQLFGECEWQKNKITELEQNISNIQMVLDEMTRFFSKDCQYSLKIDSNCYSIHRVKSVSQLAATHKCQIHGKEAVLAELRTKHLQELLSSSLKDGERWWIDGYRSNQQFQFRDGSFIMVNDTDFKQTLGKCLSLSRRNKSARLEATDCLSNTNGSHNIDSEAELQANDNNRTESLLLLLSVFAVSKSISFDEMTA